MRTVRRMLPLAACVCVCALSVVCLCLSLCLCLWLSVCVLCVYALAVDVTAECHGYYETSALASVNVTELFLMPRAWPRPRRPPAPHASR